MKSVTTMAYLISASDMPIHIACLPVEQVTLHDIKTAGVLNAAQEDAIAESDVVIYLVEGGAKKILKCPDFTSHILELPQEYLEHLKVNNIAIKCNSDEEAVDVLGVMCNTGIMCPGGVYVKPEETYYDHKSCTCYTINKRGRLSYSPLHYFKNNMQAYEIIEAAEFMETVKQKNVL